jgi:hypothetical protein
MVSRSLPLIAVLLGLLGAPAATRGQDSNITLAVDTLERLLGVEKFEVANFGPLRSATDRVRVALLSFPGGHSVRVKWAAAARGGDTFNNRPRYELAAYALQKLFLDESDYVVPPTVARIVPAESYPGGEKPPAPTFGGSTDVLVVLSYWLSNVTLQPVYDRERLASDSLYARHFAQFNILTYLVRHGDANVGNAVISADRANPRVFAVDNGVAFEDDSDRGHDWRDILVDRLPQASVDRLRGIGEQDLHRQLGVLLQLEVRDGRLVVVEPTENLDPSRGVRRRSDVIQLGLTRREIQYTYRRLEHLLARVDAGRIATF